VIVVVEGASGAGKTTWCRTHGGRHALLEELPDHAAVPSDPQAAARFWVERNAARWEEVLRRERRDGLRQGDGLKRLVRVARHDLERQGERGEQLAAARGGGGKNKARGAAHRRMGDFESPMF